MVAITFRMPSSLCLEAELETGNFKGPSEDARDSQDARRIVKGMQGIASDSYVQYLHIFGRYQDQWHQPKENPVKPGKSRCNSENEVEPDRESANGRAADGDGPAGLEQRH